MRVGVTDSGFTVEMADFARFNQAGALVIGEP